jgi:signal transduction histidine kinase
MPNNFQMLQDMIPRKRKSASNLMQFTPFGYMWVRLNSKMLVASHTIYSMLEKEPFSEFFTVDTWKSFVHPKDLYKLLQAEEELLHTGGPTVAEYRLTTQSGRQIFVKHQMYLSGLLHMEQKIMSLVQDVTEEKSAEIILEAMNESFFELDENFAFRRINEHAIKFWKLEHVDMAGKQLTAIFPQIGGTAFNNILLRAQEEKISIGQDVTDPITGHWLHLSVSPYADGLIVIFYDIQNEKAILKQASILKQSEELTQTGSWEYDVKTKEFTWSEGMYRLFNMKKGAALTSSIYLEHAIEEDKPIAQKIMSALDEKFEAFEETMRIQCDKNIKTIKAKGAPLKNHQGDIEKMMGIDMDITATRQAEEKITDLNRSLSTMNKELNVLNSELKNFAAIASSNYSETLRHLYINMELIVTNDARNLSNSGRANLRRAQGAVQKMKLLTDDINKYLSLYDTGIRKKMFEPDVVIKEVLSKLEKKIIEVDAHIELDKLPVLSADPSLFATLLWNLIDNSIKFRSPSHPLIIKIRSGQTAGMNFLSGGSKENSYIIISVTDNGTGFTQENSEKIFELFSKLHENDHYRGSGIGLAICKKIMEMHGGFITAEGVPEEGASFHCYFPT